MPNPSYFFTLFKKFQSLGHVAEGTAHGGGAPPEGVSFLNAIALLTLARGGVNLIGTNTGNTPLWMVLNAKATGSGSFSYGGLTWLPMPLGTGSALAWGDFGGAPLVSAFGQWLAAGKPNDVPAFIAIPNGGTVPGALDGGGAAVFVCSSANDDGTRPGSVPSNFWDSSLIYLVDPATGAQANPPTLHGTAEFYVAAAIGNRGNAAGGKYSAGPNSLSSPGVQATCWVLTFGTGGASPGVQLPSLSNLDINATSGTYDVYFLPSAKYEVVGFRLPVQTAFDGLVAAINQAVTDGTFTLPAGMTAQQWLQTPPSHLCIKVGVRRDDEAWPAYDASPLVERRIGQRNLVVFDVDLGPPAPVPNIIWKYFTMGGPLSQMLSGMRGFDGDLGWNTLILESDLSRQAARLLLAVPRETFKRWLGKDQARGFEVVTKDCHDQLRVPFDDHVVLVQKSDKLGLRVPFLGDHALAIAVGVEFDWGKIKPGTTRRVVASHRAVVPVFGRKKRCYEARDAVVGGFTLEFRFTGRGDKKDKQRY